MQTRVSRLTSDSRFLILQSSKPPENYTAKELYDQSALPQIAIRLKSYTAKKVIPPKSYTAEGLYHQITIQPKSYTAKELNRQIAIRLKS